jgi:hypothetical protein
MRCTCAVHVNNRNEKLSRWMKMIFVSICTAKTVSILLSRMHVYPSRLYTHTQASIVPNDHSSSSSSSSSSSYSSSASASTSAMRRVAVYAAQPVDIECDELEEKAESDLGQPPPPPYEAMVGNTTRLRSCRGTK